jgi:hypothetical protein
MASGRRDERVGYITHAPDDSTGQNNDEEEAVVSTRNGWAFLAEADG